MEVVEKSFDIVANPKAKSEVWKYFGLKKRKLDDSIAENSAICKTCESEVKCSGGTTNLATHLRRHHPMLLSSASFKAEGSSGSSSSQCSNRPVKTQSQLTIRGMFAGVKKYSANSHKASAITNKIARLIIKDLRPYRMVSTQSFKDMIYILDPQYNIPSRKQFAEVIIPNLYKTVRAEVQSHIRNADQVALTSDGWTSRATESYVTITASFITELWELANYVLQTRALPESHTAENLAADLMGAISEWKLPTKHGIPPIVTDNASNVTKAVRLTGSELHVGCFAHTINLAVQKSLKIKRVSHVLAIVRRIVAYFHRSCIAASLLKSKAELLGLPNNKLKIDVSTRWNSAFDMVSRFLELQCAVLAALRSKELGNVKDINTPSDEDITLLEDITQCLKPMKDVTTMLCTELVPTVSIILPIRFSLISSVLKHHDTDSPPITEMKRLMIEDLNRRYDDPHVTSILKLSTALDPRFKLLSHLSESERDAVFTLMTHKVVQTATAEKNVSQDFQPIEQTQPNSEELPDLPVLNVSDDPELEAGEITCDLTTVASTSNTGFSNSSPVTPVPDIPQIHVSRPVCVLENLLGHVYVNLKDDIPKSLDTLAEFQVDLYKDAAPINLDDCPLTWWKNNQNRFPLVAKLAKCVLCIPATSVPSERVFSTAGDIINAQRASLSWKHVDELIFLKKNLK